MEKRMVLLAGFAVAGIITVAGRWGWAEEESQKAEQLFQSLYGKELAEVEKTFTREDDVKLARRMMEDTKAATAEQAMFARRLLRGCHELALAAGEYALAASCQRTSVAKYQEDGIKGYERVVTAQRKVYDSAPEERKYVEGQQLIRDQRTLAEYLRKAQRVKEALAALSAARLTASAVRDEAQAEELEAWVEWLRDVDQREAARRRLLEQVEKSPEDAAANEALGEFILLKDGDPLAAAPYLKKGQKSKHRSLAELALLYRQGMVRAPRDLYVLAELYEEAAKELKTNPRVRAKYFLAAAELYQKVAESTTEAEAGAQKTAATIKADELAEAVEKLAEQGYDGTDGPRRKPGGWIRLFNGEDLSGWTKQGLARDWKVEAEAIVCDHQGPSPAVGWLTAGRSRDWRDYIVRLDCRVEQKGNTGVYLRYFGDGAPWDNAYEVNLGPECPGAFVRDKPWKKNPYDRTMTSGAWKGDSWNSVEITVSGAQLTCRVNGYLVTNATLPARDETAGYVALQFCNGGKASFRNLQAKVLQEATEEQLAGVPAFPSTEVQVRLGGEAAEERKGRATADVRVDDVRREVRQAVRRAVRRGKVGRRR